MEQQNTFTIDLDDKTGVPGFFLVRNFITKEDENELIEVINKETWNSNRANTRRVQLYVPWEEEKYKVVEKKEIRPMPESARKLASKILEFCKEHFTQFNWEEYKINEDKHTEMQVNEYGQDSHLGFHRDNPVSYREVIFGVSLLSDAYLCFEHLNEIRKILIPSLSLYLMTGPSRYKWKHGMEEKALLSGDKRISFTYRSVAYTKPVVIEPKKKKKKKKQQILVTKQESSGSEDEENLNKNE